MHPTYTQPAAHSQADTDNSNGRKRDQLAVAIEKYLDKVKRAKTPSGRPLPGNAYKVLEDIARNPERGFNRGIFKETGRLEAWPAIPTIAKATGLCDRTVQRMLKVLQEAGCLEVESGRGHRSDYFTAVQNATFVPRTGGREMRQSCPGNATAVSDLNATAVSGKCDSPVMGNATAVSDDLAEKRPVESPDEKRPGDVSPDLPGLRPGDVGTHEFFQSVVEGLGFDRHGLPQSQATPASCVPEDHWLADPGFNGAAFGTPPCRAAPPSSGDLGAPVLLRGCEPASCSHYIDDDDREYVYGYGAGDDEDNDDRDGYGVDYGSYGAGPYGGGARRPAQAVRAASPAPVKLSQTGITDQFGGSLDAWTRAVLNIDDRDPVPGVPARTNTDGGGFTNRAGTVTFTGAELAELQEAAYTVSVHAAIRTMAAEAYDVFNPGNEKACVVEAVMGWHNENLRQQQMQQQSERREQHVEAEHRHTDTE